MDNYFDFPKDFHMPRFHEIPNIDLYMDQLLAYLETILSPLMGENQEKILTTSMVNNYVKQGILPPTVKKKYGREHIAYLIIICISKQIYSITETGRLIAVQNASFDIQTAYNYICTELENVLQSTFSNQPLPADSGNSNKPERLLVRNSTIAFAHKIYTQRLCDYLYQKEIEKQQK